MLEQTPFRDAGREVARHPFLAEAAAGTLPMAKWSRYFSARLETGPSFVRFLERLSRQAGMLGLEGAAAAVEGNRSEELGIAGGEVVLERAHHEWRRWFREGMAKVMAERGFPLTDGPAPDFTEVQGYPAAFNALGDEGDVIKSMGALAVFEIGLGDEYAQILAGMDIVFPNALTPKQRTYLVGHARHEARHFEEIYGPLAALCTTRGNVARALAGAETAKRVKLGFLDGAYRLPA